MRRIRTACAILVLIPVMVYGYEYLQAIPRDSTPFWLKAEDPERDQQQITQMIWNQLDVRRGLSVADVGAGGGYFTFRLSSAVGPEGRVYATDVEATTVELLAKRREERDAANVIPLKVPPDSLGVPPNSVDRILMINVYPFTRCRAERTQKFFREAAEALRPGGRIVIMHDFVHLKGWSGSVGDPLICDQESLEGLKSFATRRFEVLFSETVPYSEGPLELPGYLLVLEKRAEEKLPSTAIGEDEHATRRP
jgi:precorrin-6B methylase 2